MLTVIIIMVSGVLVGYLFQNHKWISKPVNIIITWCVYLLLFLLGLSVGGNEIIIENIVNLGAKALLLTIGALAGSVLLSWLTFNLFFRSDEK